MPDLARKWMQMQQCNNMRCSAYVVRTFGAGKQQLLEDQHRPVRCGCPSCPSRTEIQNIQTPVPTLARVLPHDRRGRRPAGACYPVSIAGLASEPIRSPTPDPPPSSGSEEAVVHLDSTDLAPSCTCRTTCWVLSKTGAFESPQ
ncbi:unnamed protein product [Symbiodinium natans]|uniref:Uncharacterized protein n=1 Tax=Symbiodinium natans TaxID=878477 RepID=A0A812RUZ7_9DINO|nr:unnamed protein product [Symbiodinium natans]